MQFRRRTFSPSSRRIFPFTTRRSSSRFAIPLASRKSEGSRALPGLRTMCVVSRPPSWLLSGTVGERARGGGL